MKKQERRAQATSCETCANYVYEDEYGYYACMVSLDEDEYGRFLTSTVQSCPYYRLDDEYRVVRHQM